MGMYTELVMACQFKENLPDDVLKILKSLIGEVEAPDHTPQHEFFQTDRWRRMFLMGSYYFTGGGHSRLEFDSVLNMHVLTVRCSLKNYDAEIEKFLAWIALYVDDKGFIGYKRYETEDHPTLIYLVKGKIKFVKIGEEE